MTHQKKFAEKNSTTQNKVINDERIGLNELPKIARLTCFGEIVWLTSITIDYLSLCHLIFIFEIFLMILVVSLFKLRCASKIFFLSLASLFINYKKERKEKITKKKRS